MAMHFQEPGTVIVVTDKYKLPLSLATCRMLEKSAMDWHVLTAAGHAIRQHDIALMLTIMGKQLVHQSACHASLADVPNVDDTLFALAGTLVEKLRRMPMPA